LFYPLKPVKIYTMTNDLSKTFWQVLGLGIIAGMRSMTAPAVASHYLAKDPSASLEDSPLKFLQSTQVADVLKLVAATEMAGDKIPGVPDRIATGALFGRGLSGALVGAALYKANKGNVAAGALLGSAAAVAGTFGSFYLRKELKHLSGIADPILGVLEDALVVKGGTELLSDSKGTN
jgi:uncharacterized membrane protein